MDRLNRRHLDVFSNLRFRDVPGVRTYQCFSWSLCLSFVLSWNDDYSIPSLTKCNCLVKSIDEFSEKPKILSTHSGFLRLRIYCLSINPDTQNKLKEKKIQGRIYRQRLSWWKMQIEEWNQIFKILLSLFSPCSPLHNCPLQHGF